MNNKSIALRPEFKRQATKAVVSIVIFILSYVGLFLLTIGLTILCGWGAISIIQLFPGLVTLALGIGLASLGVLVLIFLLKFTVKSTIINRAGFVEINEKSEPKLFALISEIVEEVGTDKPKKVYLSGDVNAGVFYDSSFWSMIFPVRKNLQIGLGLINSITTSELKSILAHEFGHFSQRSMRVGSYVYNANKVIHNMLYDNDSYNRLIQNWGNISGYFSPFVGIAEAIIEAIQSILQSVYDNLNGNYFALSREMEFHADEVAVNITGSNPLKASLLRLSLSEFSFNMVLSFYEANLKKGVRSENVFAEQAFVIGFFAKRSKLEFEHGLPVVNLEDINKYSKSKLEIGDQWASHPSIEDRIERMEALGISKDDDLNQPANSLLSEADSIQKEITKHFFEGIESTGETVMYSLEDFQSAFIAEAERNTFADVYNGYYDNWSIKRFEIAEAKPSGNQPSPDLLFSNEKVDLIYSAVSIQNDINMLGQIKYGKQIRSFDYDGVKYGKRDVKAVVTKLTKELNHVNERIRQNDIDVYCYFKSIDRDHQLDKLYTTWFEFDEKYDYWLSVYTNISKDISFLGANTPYQQINSNFNNIRGNSERKLRENLASMLADSNYQNDMTEDVKKDIEHYLSKDWNYFDSVNYIEANLQLLFTAINHYITLLTNRQFLVKKALLDYQYDLITVKATQV